MPDTDPRQILARAQSRRQRPAGPQGRDRAPRTRASTSSRGCPSGARGASRCCSSMASSPARGSGSATSATSRPGLGGSRPQPAQPLLVADRRPDDALVRHLHRGRRRRDRPARPSVVAVGHGMGGLLALKAAERMPISGLVLLSSELPRELREPTRGRTSCARSPTSTARALIGWETLPEKLLRDDRDLTLADVLRIQHLLGQKPHEAGAARRQMLAGRPGRSPRAAGDAAAGRRGRPRPGGHARRQPSASPSGSTRLRALRRALPLRPGRRREQLSSRSPSRSGGSSRRTGCRGPLAAPRFDGGLDLAGIMPTGRGGTARPPAPHSSRGPGHRPLKAEITGSNPVCGTNIAFPDAPGPRTRGRSHVRTVARAHATDR